MAAEERRRYRRHNVNILASFCVLKAPGIALRRTFDAIIVDMGEWGLSLVTDHSTPIANIIIIEFNLIDARADKRERVMPLKVRGEIVYNMALKDKECRLGVRLIDLDGKSRNSIARFLNHIAQ